MAKETINAMVGEPRAMASNLSGDRDRDASDGLTEAASIARRADAKTWLRLIFFVFVLACLATPLLLIPMYLLRETEPFDGLLKEVGDNSDEPAHSGTVVLGVAFVAGVALFLIGIAGQIRRWRRRPSMPA